LEKGIGPVDSYGLSKLAAEDYITKSKVNSLILRALEENKIKLEGEDIGR